MINALIRFAVSQRLLVLLMVLIMTGAGLYSLINLPIDAVPDVTNVQVQVLTAAPSLAPLEIERQITFPVEVAMSGLPDIEEIRSVSKFGLSAVTVVFHDSVDTYFARQLVLERLSQAREQIPENIGSPEMGPISTGLGEIYQYELKAAKGSGYDATALRTIQDWSVRRQLLGVPGVTEVNSFGGYEKQYQVRLDPAKLQSYGLSLRNVVEAVTQNNANVGGAYIEHGSEQYLLRGIGLVESPEDIGNIIVKTGKEGIPVYVRDLGEIVTGATVRQGAVTADGEGEIVAGIAMMLKGENSRTVVDRVKERVEQVKKTLPQGSPAHSFLRSDGTGRPHDLDGREEPDRRRDPGDRRAHSAARKLARQFAGRHDYPALDAVRRDSDARLQCLGQPDESRRARLRLDRGRRGGDGREHGAAPRRSPALRVRMNDPSGRSSRRASK